MTEQYKAYFPHQVTKGKKEENCDKTITVVLETFLFSYIGPILLVVT